MTIIGSNPLRRETCALARGRPLVIELHAWGLRIREKGRRFHYDIGYAAIYETAGKIAAREERAARAEGRRKR